MNTGRIAIGSRGSALALAQARLVAEALEREGCTTRLVVVETEGDRRAPDTEWGEGAFVVAIERALLDGRVDVAAHSAKDVPIDQDERLRIAAYLPRADPRDALVVRSDASERRLADLKPGTRVGTDSPRRAGFLLAHRPDLIVHPLHGNVDTRLRRLDESETDALVLACAGLDRMDLGARIAERLAPETVPPAPGQGAIAVQIRSDDARMLRLATPIDDPRTRAAVEAERAFLESSGGGCRAPIGALATISAGELELFAGHASPDGSTTIFGHRRGPVEDGRRMAVELAAELLPEARLGGSSTTSQDASTRPPRVLVTRATGQSEALVLALRGAGLEPVEVPAISIEIDPPGSDLDRAAGSLSWFQWVLVTSANGAQAILGAAERVRAELGSPRWGAIGPATSAILDQEGIGVDFVPSRSHGSAMAAELPIREGDRVLVIRGDLAGSDLAERLRTRGAEVDDVVAYRTLEAPPSSRSLLRQAMAEGAFDAVVFTSGSTIRGLRSLAAAVALDITAIPAVCIGPETADEAARAGFRLLAVASSQDANTLARTTASALTPQPQEIP
ncbi:MAG: hydroxymethylbilane synthase [Chloroflexota bacterium]